MSKTEQISKYIRDVFKLYNLNENEFFIEFDDELDELVEIPLFISNEIDDETLAHVSTYIGLSKDEILNMDSQAANRYFLKYPYFKLLPEALSAYNRQLEAYMKKFPTTLGRIEEELLLYTKLHNIFLPGTYHEGATIENLSAETHIIASFDGATELWESYIEMVETVKNLFLKILFGNDPLTDEEINEYNFLVSSLNITDAICQYPLHYSTVIKLLDVYHEEGYCDFYSFARINLGLFSELDLHPWCFKETAGDKNIIQNYANIHPVINGTLTKEYLRKYALKAKNYYCTFEWSDAPIIDTGYNDIGIEVKEGTIIYLPKDELETKDYAEACALLSNLASPPKSGGITMPERELPYQHYFQMNTEPWCKRHFARTARMRGAQ